MSRFVIRTLASGVKFDLKAANGQTIASSEVYATLAACRNGMESVRKNAATAHFEDLTADLPAPQPNPKFELYQDKGGLFRFRLRSRNGKTIAVSDAYVTKAGCKDGIHSVKAYASTAAVEEEF